MALAEVGELQKVGRFSLGPRIYVRETRNLVFIHTDDRRRLPSDNPFEQKSSSVEIVIKEDRQAGIKLSQDEINARVLGLVNNITDPEVIAQKPLLMLETPALATALAHRLRLIPQDQEADRLIWGNEPGTRRRAEQQRSHFDRTVVLSSILW